MNYQIIQNGEEFAVAKEGETAPVDSERFASQAEAETHMAELERADAKTPAGETDPGDKPENEAKSIDLDEWSSRVRTAIYDLFPAPLNGPSDVWVERVFDDAVIACSKLNKWRIPYTMTEDGTVTFAGVAEWTQVEMTYVPVGMREVEDSRMEVKALPDGRIRAYALVWGDQEHTDLSDRRDYFTPKTDFWDRQLPMPRPLTYHHGWNAETKSFPVIGKIDEFGDDEIGRWYIAELDKAHRYEKGVRALIAQRALKSSVDSIPQYARREAKANGANEVLVYPLFGVTLTPTPAEPRLMPAQEMKSLYQQIGVELKLPEAAAETAATREGNQRAGAAKQKDATHQKPDQLVHPEAKTMNEQELLALLEKRDKEKQAAAEAEALEEKRIEEMAEAKAQAKLAQLAKDRGLAIFSGGASRVNVASKYDDMKLEDMAFLATVRGEAKAIGKSKGVDEILARALVARSVKAVAQGELEAKALEDLFPELPVEAKANEVMQSTLANYGDEWVPTNYSSQLWMTVRAKARLLRDGFIPEQEIPKGYESDTIPLESTDFTFYNVAQAATEDSTMKTVPATIPSSKMGTGQRVITVGKAGARGYVTGELDEDSIIDAIPEARAKLERQLPPEIEFLLFNMDDTAATDNINGNGTPTTGADYTIGKGIIRNALKNNSAANAVDWSAVITSAKVISLYNLLGADGELVWDDPTATRGFTDYLTWSKLMGLSDLLTVANAGEANATIVRGANADGGIPIFGVRWYATTGVKKAQATGIRHGTEGSNTKGRAVLVRGDQWKLRWKRRAKFETTRVAAADLTELVVTMRLGIGYFDTEASAIAYNCA